MNAHKRCVMRLWPLLTVIIAGCGADRPGEPLAVQLPLIENYCADCHNGLDFAGELSLENIGPEDIAAHPETWESVVQKLRGRLMPPPGAPHPGAASVDALATVLEAALDVAGAARGPAPGRVVLHRLNRSEYGAAIEQLLGLRVDPADLLPPDIAADGFDNVAEVLKVSPTYLDQYIAAARQISLAAVGDADAAPRRSVFVANNTNHTRHVAGLPLGTRGGMVVDYYFPADGDYVFSMDVSSEPGAELRAYPQGWLEYRHTGLLTIDGERVFAAALGGPEELRAVDQDQIAAVNEIRGRFHNITLPVTAGYHRIGATFAARSFAESDYLLESFIPGEGVPDVPRMLGLEIVGPYESAGFSAPTVSRQRIFSCYPEASDAELGCAEDILTRLARSAYRRPLTATDVDTLLGFYARGAERDGFEGGIQMGLMAILSSTNFLYRIEPDNEPGERLAAMAYPVSDLELAWRLSFLMWNAGPDEQLLGLAEAGRLSAPDVYAAEVSRLFADPRAQSLVSNFAFQWLGVRDSESVEPDPRLFPDFDTDLREAFATEMAMFLGDILLDESVSVMELLGARHTYLNERLARHYGINSVRGDRFRRVELTDSARWGLFGKGNVLLATSYPDRTSPVLRGAWIMEEVLGAPPSAPPPGVETNLQAVEVGVPRSVRERLELHRTVPSCNHCHGVIDPLGQALENFDAVGAWRTMERDSGAAIDATGELAGRREPVAGPDDLRAALLREPERFVTTLTRKLMTYALGRTVEYADMPEIRRIVREARTENYSFAALVRGVAGSVPFKMREAAASAAAETAVASREASVNQR